MTSHHELASVDAYCVRFIGGWLLQSIRPATCSFHR